MENENFFNDKCECTKIEGPVRTLDYAAIMEQVQELNRRKAKASSIMTQISNANIISKSGEFTAE